ncbi:MAG: DegV family protein [Anaerolineae bacterium]|nr:DegV family protein [Anaerolineae bacterium]
MRVVTDGGMDLSPQQREGLDIYQVPLLITLDGKTYRSGIDVGIEEFYNLLESAAGLPTTSLPSPGEFAETYHDLAKTDPDILSIHISSGLSSTFNASQAGAELVPEANVTPVDTMTLSGAMGWQVEAAARAAQAGWAVERILDLVGQVRKATETVFTLPDLKYLIHGGRIGHLKGLIASALKIMPLISVSKQDGKYFVRSQKRTFARALPALADIIAQDHPDGTPLRVQVAHAKNPEGAEQLREVIDRRFKCQWLPTCAIAPVLGAHTGPGLVGVIYAALDQFPALP